MTSKKSRRKSYLIDRKFQLSFILKFLSILVIFVLLTGFSIIMIYYIKYQSGKSFFDNYLVIVREGEAIEITNMFDVIAPVMIISSLIIVFFTSIYGLFYSHKIAVPIYRVKRTLESMCRGILNFNVKLRKKDKFQYLEEHLNKIINIFNHEIVTLKKHNNGLLIKIKEVKKILSGSTVNKKKINTLINEIKKVNLNMHARLSKFKTKAD